MKMGKKKNIELKPFAYNLSLEDDWTIEKYRRIYNFKTRSEALRDILKRIRKNMGWEKEIEEAIKS
jgi:hypothetical protein